MKRCERWPARCTNTGSPACGSVIARQRSRTAHSMGKESSHVNLWH
jgi:hypothetical protein